MSLHTVTCRCLQGDLSKGEFRQQARKLGLAADKKALDELFDSFELNSSGSMDIKRMKVRAPNPSFQPFVELVTTIHQADEARARRGPNVATTSRRLFWP